MRATGQLFGRAGRAALRQDAQVLGALLNQGGALFVISDDQGPLARILIQPDADVLISYALRCMTDPAARTRIRDEQLALSQRLGFVAQPIDVMWSMAHVPGAAVCLYIAVQAAENLQDWLAQMAVSFGIMLIGTFAVSLLRRLALRWLLRRM